MGQLVTLREVEGVVPVQLIVMVSEGGETMEHEPWSEWLESLDFWHKPKPVDLKLRLSKKGQVWGVEWQL